MTAVSAQRTCAGCTACGELVAESDLGEVLECAISIRERAADGGERAFGADEALLDGGVAGWRGLRTAARKLYPRVVWTLRSRGR